MTILVAIAASYDDGAALPRQMTSNARTLLASSAIDPLTGDAVALTGFVHVQTKADLVAGTVAVHANVMRVFLAYPEALRPPSDPALDRVDELVARVNELKAEIAAARQTLLDLEAQLKDALETDVNPFLPGLQVDEDEVRRLQRALALAGQALQQLQEELRAISREIEDLLDDLQQRGEPFDQYDLAGADQVAAAPCLAALACERLVAFDLVRADGSRSSVAVLLRLLFSTRGELISVVPEISCEASCSVDDDACYCP